MSDQDNVVESVLEALRRTDLRDALAQLAQMRLDAVLDNSILRSAPAVAAMTKLVAGEGNARDRIFVKKLYRFLAALEPIPVFKREAQITRLAPDPDARQQFGEHLLLLLDRHNHMEKPALLARAFRYLLEGKINPREFDGLAYAIEALVMHDVAVFDEHYREFGKGGPPQWEEKFAGLHHAGLLTIRLVQFDDIMYTESPLKPQILEGRYHLTQTGKLFHDYVLEKSTGLDC